MAEEGDSDRGRRAARAMVPLWRWARAVSKEGHAELGPMEAGVEGVRGGAKPAATRRSRSRSNSQKLRKGSLGSLGRGQSWL